MSTTNDRKYAVFILSHGRPDRIHTLTTLEKGGYTGDWYIVCDDTDQTLDEYRRRYGDRVLVFSKTEWHERTDVMDNLGVGKVVVYARNAVWEFARQLGLTHFVVLDDDYIKIKYIMVFQRKNGSFFRREPWVRNLDRLIELTFDMLDESNALCVAWAQGGDFPLGTGTTFLLQGWKRKAMNAFFFRTDRRMEFMGRLNEDTNAYIYHGMRGDLIYTVTCVCVAQERTQQQPGGLTDAYLSLGTYVKSFYTVMLAPSCVEVATMGVRFYRLHHRILWDYAVPKIISDRYRKPDPVGADQGR